MKFLPLFYWAIKELLMLQWFDIDKDWGEVRKSIMFLAVSKLG